MGALTFLGAFLLALAVAGVLPRQSAPRAQPSFVRPTFDAALVGRGATLVAIGNCGTCHTAEGGKTLAGGRPLITPFGTVHSTNLTPDPDTGIGRWSQGDFLRAMHEGIGRDGQQLYPAFPYDHYTQVDEEDVNAIFAYLMTREPIRAETPANRMLVARPFVAFWKALYFKQGPLAPDSAHDAEWNRGRYLTEGLGHCGACHTPRNAFGAEERERQLAGGRIDGWSAPALNAQSPAPHPWSVDELTSYLRTGFSARHGVAAGAMAPVTRNLGMVPAGDVRAIAVYVVSQMRGARTDVADAPAGEGAQNAEDAVPDALGTANAADGASIFRSACAGCHERTRRAVSLALSSAVTDTTSANLIRVTLEGIRPPEGEPGGIMPGFGGALTDRQMAALADYVRTQIGHAPAWTDVEREIARARDERKAPATS